MNEEEVKVDAAEDAAPSDEVVETQDGTEEVVTTASEDDVLEVGDEVVVDQAMLDENPELVEAGVEVGDEGVVVDAPLEGESLDENLRERANDVLENPESVQSGDPVPSDGQPV